MEKIGIIGGDQRQIYVKQFLEEHGWQTETAFFPDGTRQEETTERLREIFENCRFVVLPVPVLRKGKLNTGAEYKPDAEQLMEYVKHGQCIFGGCFSKELKNRILCRGGGTDCKRKCSCHSRRCGCRSGTKQSGYASGEFVYSDRVWPMRKCNSSVPEKLGMYDRGV